VFTSLVADLINAHSSGPAARQVVRLGGSQVGSQRPLPYQLKPRAG
jgi:hypothetical protein